MKTLKPHRRSISPFGVVEKPRDKFNEIADLIDAVWEEFEIPKLSRLKTLSDIRGVAQVLRKIFNSPSNDGPMCCKADIIIWERLG